MRQQKELENQTEYRVKYMNQENLHELINRYENNYDLVNNSTNDEKFKWGAVRGFRDVWFSQKASEMSFAQMFDAATKRSSVLINNRIVSPTTGIVKMAEQRPDEVERLFRELLFAEYTTIPELQNHMDGFLEQIEKIRQELFPRFYRYKQERHAASCYLAFYAPEKHFIYRYSEAEEFAQYIEFGKDLGAGSDFKLENYYELAEIVVAALKEHPSLIDKHDALFKGNDHYYYDESLHLMAFDLMYCCRCYNFYAGLHHAKKKDSIKAYTAQQLKEKEEAERQQKITELEDEIHAIDVQMEMYDEISLLGVEVTQAMYGTGTVIAQKGSLITVEFPEKTTSYTINKKFPMRPRFENDDEVVEAFTQYDMLKAQKRKKEEELKRL